MISPRPFQWSTWFARLAGGSVLFMGIVVLLGWVLDVGILKSILPQWSSMVPVTALNFALCGTGLWCAVGGQEDKKKLALLVPSICGGIVVFLGLLRLYGHIAGWNPGIDHLGFLPTPGPSGKPGSMSPATSFDFILMGGALLLAPRTRPFFPFQFLALLGLLIGWLGFARYFYGGQPLGPLTQMAAHTALGFLILSVGILCARPDRGLMGLLGTGSAGGLLVRRLLPAAMLLPLAFSLVLLQMQRAGWFGVEGGVALLSLTSVIVFGGLVWAIGLLLHRTDMMRRQAEEMRVRHAAIVESTDDAIVGRTLDGIVTSWNRGAEQMFGYAANEAIGRRLKKLFPPGIAAEEAEMLRRVARGERIDHFKTVRITKDGRRVEISASISPIKDASGKITGASKIARDITGQKLAEEKAEWLASFPGRNPIPIVEVELEKGVVHYANPVALRLFPDLQSKGLDHPWLELLSRFAQPLLTGKKEVLRRDITVGDACYSQNVSYIPETKRLRVYGVDITERRQAEQKLQSQLERLDLLRKITRAIGERQDLKSIFQVVIRSLEDHLPVSFCCICLYRSSDKILTVNSVGVRSRMLAMELAMTEQAVIPIDENGLSRCVQGQLVYEPDISEVRFPFPQRLAQVGLKALVAAPLQVESSIFGVLIAARGEAGSFSSAECEFLRQVSEHAALASHQAQLYEALRQAYNDLRQSQQAVLQQERLRALGQMASGIAHDINNAISPASLYAESLLEREPNLSERARNYLTTIQNAIEDVAATVSRMKEFYRQREPQLVLEPVDLGKLVEQVVNLTKVRWSGMPQRNGVVINLNQELSPDLPYAMGVESEIREALTNLVLNAADAMPEGGTLTVRTSFAESADGARVNVEVTDTGVGMDEETRSRCLEPFFTTKGERGTGLGLAMVYGTAQRHGADIVVESAPGKGTTVRLGFPPAATGAEPSQHEPELFVVPTRLRILTIDDDPVVIKSLQDTLESDGHIVTAANDGRDGIDIFRNALERGEPFAVVLTDLGMPYVDGRKVAATVKELSPATPVILLTGWGQRLVEEGDVPPHVDCVLNKPPKLRTLREALARCVKQPAAGQNANQTITV